MNWLEDILTHTSSPDATCLYLIDGGLCNCSVIPTIEAIRTKLLEAIGEEQDSDDCPHGGFDWDTYCIVGANKLRAEIRQKLEIEDRDE